LKNIKFQNPEGAKAPPQLPSSDTNSHQQHIYHQTKRLHKISILLETS